MTYAPPPVVLERLERYGDLVVLRSFAGGRKYRCGCACGNSKFFVRRSKLLNGRVKHCDRSVHATGLPR